MPSNRHLTPHDALFKKSLQRSAVAEQFLRRYLPLSLREAVEWGTLTVENVELVDGNLQKMACDVVFSFKLKQQQDGYIYILLEHQRMMDPLLPFRLLKYGVHLISRHLKKNAESKLLPVIFPLVIYNGDASYSCSTCLLDLFPIELRDHVQQFLVGQHQVLDLVHSHNCINPGDIWVAPMLEALRQGSNKNITNQYIGDIVSALDRLADQEDIGYISEILHYLCAVQDASHYEQLWKTLLIALKPKLGEGTMGSIADIFRDEGREIGQVTMMKKMLSSGMSMKQVSDISGFNLQELEVMVGASDAVPLSYPDLGFKHPGSGPVDNLKS